MRWRSNFSQNEVVRFPAALYVCQHTSCLILAIYTFHHTYCVTSLCGLYKHVHCGPPCMDFFGCSSLTSNWLDYHYARFKIFVCTEFLNLRPGCREYEGIMIVLVNQAFLYLHLGLWCGRFVVGIKLSHMTYGASCPFTRLRHWTFEMLACLVTSIVFISIAKTVSAATYSLASNLVGQGFLNAFSWEAIADPTNGRVNYVAESTAQADGLVSVSGTQVNLRADSTTVLSSSDPGRNSFRLQSNAQYTTHVAVFDIAHMPQGCGTWPAIWEVGANWPNEGEVDIVEGVNNQSPNLSSLHTSANCTMPDSRSMTGTSTGTNCDVYETSNSGCGVQANDINSFGPDFNGIGGGWYAIERTTTFIKVYFWERESSSVPNDVQYPGTSVNTDNWGTPTAYFPDTDCDFSTHFGPHNIIINLTFCGDWAGNSAVYNASGCPSDCVDYVNQNPSAFVDAYFTFNSLNIYE